MRWVVYGAGAVGGVLGARMFEAGHDVVLVARGEHLRAIRRRGLTLATPDGSRDLPVPVVASAADLDLSVPSTILLAVKSHQTAAAVEDLTASGWYGSAVVSVQNGVANEPHLLRFFSDVQGVCVMLPAGHLEPGVVEQHSATVPGILDVGSFPTGVDATTGRVSEAFVSAGFASEPHHDVMAAKHRKLLTNLGNAVRACCAPGEAAERLTELAVTEGESVLSAAGIRVTTRDEDRARRGDLVQVRHGPGLRRGDSSWQSLHRGTGSIESDYLNGEIVLLGRLHGVPTPCNELLRRTASRLSQEGAAPASLDAADLLHELG